MCGIVGYNGKNSVTDLLLDSLELLEYRGYDSAGLATMNAIPIFQFTFREDGSSKFYNEC